MQKQTTVNQIEIAGDGSIGVRLAKQIVDDDGTVLSSQWHRTLMPPGTDIDAQMAAVNASLTGMNAAAVAPADIDRIKAYAITAWTVDAIAAYAAKAAAEQAA